MLLQRVSLIALVVWLGGLSSTAIADDQADWTQWRGPQRDGRLPGSNWPGTLNKENLQPVWSVTLGPSYSGPIITADRVFVTETKDREAEVVRALQRTTGKQLWETNWSGAMEVPFFAKANGDWIRATPCLDGDRLYVAGMRDVLVCLNTKTGKEIWRVDFPEQFKTPLPSFGFVSSPLVVDDAIYVQAAGSLVKLDKMTGKVIWRVLEDGGGMQGGAFSSPVYATVLGVAQLVVQTRSHLAGVDPQTGKVLWSQQVPAFRGMNILTPTIYEDSVFTSTYQNNSFFYTLSEQNQKMKVASTWKSRRKGYMSSPILYQGHVYLHLQNRRLACIDLKDGKEKWITKPFGQYWSMVAQGDKILALDNRGVLRLIRATPDKFELLGEVKLAANDTWAHLAVTGDLVWVRSIDNLTAYRWTE